MPYCILQNDGKTIAQICFGHQPNGSIEITDEIANSPEDYLYQNNQFVYTPNLVPRKQAKIDEFNSACDLQIISGFNSSALGPTHIYPSDKEAQDYLKDCIKRLEIDSTKTTVGFKTLDAGYLDHTLAQLHQVFKDGFDNGDNLIMKYNIKKNQINQCTSQEQIDTVGWPTNPNPPSIPTGLAGTAGTAQVSLTWMANTDVMMIGGGGYNVYQNGTKINTSLVTSNSFSVTGLTAGANYQFQITAVDTDGLESAKCTAVSVTSS